MAVCIHILLYLPEKNKNKKIGCLVVLPEAEKTVLLHVCKEKLCRLHFSCVKLLEQVNVRDDDLVGNSRTSQEKVKLLDVYTTRS